MRLLGCSYLDASEYIEQRTVEITDFEEAAAKFFEDEKTEDIFSRVLQFPENFRPLRNQRGRARLYYRYLLSRGFLDSDIPRLARRYKLHYCDRGKWRGRIIFPMYVEQKLVSWTGRSVYVDEKQRYNHLSHKETADPRGLINIRDMLYNYNKAISRKWKTCVIVEGPLDAIRVDWYGHRYGITSVATLGTGIRDAQLDLIEYIREHCENLVVCGDQGAEANVLDILSKLTGMQIRSITLPREVEDPGELSPKQVRQLFTI